MYLGQANGEQTEILIPDAYSLGPSGALVLRQVTDDYVMNYDPSRAYLPSGGEALVDQGVYQALIQANPSQGFSIVDTINKLAPTVALITPAIAAALKSKGVTVSPQGAMTSSGTYQAMLTPPGAIPGWMYGVVIGLVALMVTRR